MMISNLSCDVIIIGSGIGGSLAANRILSKGKSVLLLEAGKSFSRNISITKSLYINYWNGGVIPLFGPFICPFGEAKVFGGGSIINGALVWNLPEKIRKKWSDLLPKSVFNSPEWFKTEQKINNELKVSNQHSSYHNGNLASKLLAQEAINQNMGVVQVPRAVDDCKNSNRCGSGCPLEAKNTVDKVYLKDHPLLYIEKESLVYRIRKLKNEWSVQFIQKNKKKNVRAKKVVISAGATESANILRKSGLSYSAGKDFQFHLNFKLLAKFTSSIDADHGTILTHQVQNYMDDGILIMSSNHRKPYLASSLAHLPPKNFHEYIKLSDNIGIYAVQIRPDIKASINSLFGQTFGFWKWSQDSFLRTKKGIEILAKILFDAGAEEIILPLKNNKSIIKDKIELKVCLEKCTENELIGLSVHGMSACKMGDSPRNSVVNLDGQVWGNDNLYVLDSSILPTNIGESPQGAILTTIDLILQKWK
jgi:choline dehydrogenase-like flavoprotein